MPLHLFQKLNRRIRDLAFPASRDQEVVQIDVGGQAHGLHLVAEEEGILEAATLHGTDDERVEGVARRLDSVEHHVLVDVPQQEIPSLGDEGVDDGVVLGDVGGVVPPGVLRRVHREGPERRQAGQRRAVTSCVRPKNGGKNCKLVTC